MEPDFKINIPKPCRAGWNTMEAAEKGKFCKECSKIVIDFTAMSLDEIKTYFIQHKDQRICGHFISTQVNKSTSKSETILIHLHLKAEKMRFKIPRIAACFIIVSLMTLSGCGPTTGELKEHTTRDSLYVTKEMQQHTDSLERATDNIAKQEKH